MILEQLAAIHWMLFAQATTETLIKGWTEAKSISVVLSILTIVLFYVSWYLLRLYIKKSEEFHKAMIQIHTDHEKAQLELQSSNTDLLKEVTTAITELATLFRERGVSG